MSFNADPSKGDHTKTVPPTETTWWSNFGNLAGFTSALASCVEEICAEAFCSARGACNGYGAFCFGIACIPVEVLRRLRDEIYEFKK